MKIKSLQISNFKSFRSIDLHLSDFNVLVGQNASGKSNFLNIFRFIRDIVTDGLENAISMQGGIEFLRNMALAKEVDKMHFRVVVDAENTGFASKRNTKTEFVMQDFMLEFILQFDRQNTEYSIVQDRLVKTFEVFHRSTAAQGKIVSKGLCHLHVNNVNSMLTISLDNRSAIKKLAIEDFYPMDAIPTKVFPSNSKNKKLLIESDLYFINNLLNLKSFFEDTSIYFFETSLPKQAASVAGKAELEENGENLALVLRRILTDEDKKRSLFNLVRHVLPFIEKIDVTRYLNKYLQIVLKETYSSAENVPSFLMSDGTIILLALIIAIYFEQKPLSIFDEPERSIHPYLISKLIEMMREASTQKQIIVATHHPEVVKYAGLDNLLLVQRDKNGFSVVNRPIEKREIKTFLKNEIGIEELYVQNLLG